MSRGRRVRFIAFCINAISMTYTIYHLFEDARPFDWLMFSIEVAVLFAILIFDIRAVRRERRQDRERRERKALVDKRVAALRDALSKGQELQLRTPGSGDPYVAAWRDAVSNWGEETRRLLKSFSEHAETAFSLPMPSLPYITGSVGAVSEFVSLISHLNNLRGIIEKPDVYL